MASEGRWSGGERDVVSVRGPSLHRRRVLRSAAGVLCLVLATVVACTDEQPQPSTSPPVEEDVEDDQPAPALGTRVAVVLPPATRMAQPVLATMAAQLELLPDLLGPEVQEVRALIPDGPAFTSDLATTFAAREPRVLCVVGDGATDLLTPLATRHPTVRFCALPVAAATVDAAAAGTGSPAAPDPEADDEDVVELELRSAELGHLAGVAARAAAADGDVGVLFGADVVADEAFRTGLVAGLGGLEPVEPGDLDPDATAAQRARALVDAGAEVVVVDGSVDAPEAAAAIAGDVVLIGPGAVLDEVRGTSVAATWTVRWDQVLRDVVARTAGLEPVATTTSFGLREGVFEVAVGAGATAPMGAAIRRAEHELEEGDRDPLVPRPAARPAPPDDDPPADDGPPTDADAAEDGDDGEGDEDDAPDG